MVRESFDERLHRYIPFCQPGLTEYLADVLSHPLAFSAFRAYVAVAEDGALCGFAQLTCNAASGADHLNYLCVATAHRGRGIASRLLAHHLDSTREARDVALDLFSHNAAARQLYERLGFERESASTWQVLDVPPPITDPSLAVLDPHMCLASLHRYGFARAAVVRAGKLIDVAMPSRAVMRVANVEDLMDDDLVRGLRAILPDIEQVMASVPETTTALPGTSIVESLRLRCRHEVIRSRL